MQKLTCLIIEDEPIAAEVLKDYIKEIKFLDLRGICKDAIYALETLKREQIDVIFLDIHLPKLKGLDFLKSLTVTPQIILTTAYHEYAVDAFTLGVVDYLMKPIAFSRFLKAVNKLNFNKGGLVKEENLQHSTPNSRPFQLFTTNKKNVKVYIDEIVYIESLKDYIRINTKTSNLVIRGQIGLVYERFSSLDFLRIHRSIIVALDKIQAYNSSEIEIHGKVFPIGRSYKKMVLERLDRYFKNEM